MSEQSVTLAPGQVTTISTGMAAGTTIYNGDPSNAAWVSGNPTPGPGSGMRIGPKGSLQWTTAGPVYGAVDTGVTSPIVLTASSNVGSLVNPVDVGAAVATQLLNQGVPNVLQGTVIAAGSALPLVSTTNYAITKLDVSKYASLTITLNVPSQAQVSAAFTTPDGSYNLGSFDFPVTHVSGAVTFTLPVTGPALALYVSNVVAANNTYTIYGSNRGVEKPRIMTGYSTATTLNLSNTAFTLGTPAYFPDPFISNGKNTYLRLVVTGTGSGKFGFTGFTGPSNSVGALTLLDLVDSKLGGAGSDGAETEKTILLPPGKLKLHFMPGVTATYTVVATLTQEF